MQEPITFLEQEMLDEIKAARSIQVICGKDYDLQNNLFHFFDVYMGMKCGIIYDQTLRSNASEESDMFHVCRCVGSNRAYWMNSESAYLSRKEADPNLVFLVTVKLTERERRNAERKFGKMVYIQNRDGISHNTNCDVTFTNVGGITMTSKNFVNRPCKIESSTAHLSYDLEILSNAEELILSGRSVFLKSYSGTLQKIATKLSFVRKCTQHWIILRSTIGTRDIIDQIMQLIVADFEGTLTLK